MMQQQDLFQITFKILQQQLIEKSNPYGNDSYFSHDNNRFCLSNPIVMDIRKSVKMRLENISKMRKLSRSRANYAIKVNQIVAADITSKKNAAFQSTCHRKAALHQRLLQQQQISERRLRELIFEITGEYGKSEMRIHRRYEFMRISGRINITQCIWRLRWEKFSQRLGYEAGKSRSEKRKFNANNSIQYEVLNLRENVDEIKLVTEKLRRRSASEAVTSMKVVAVIRYVRKIDIPVQLNTNTNLVNVPNTMPKAKPLVTNQVADMQTFLHEIKMWALSGNPVGSTRTSSNNGSMTPTTRNYQTNNSTAATVTAAHNMLKELITCSCIEWLHPPSYLTDIFDHKSFNNEQIKPASTKSNNRKKYPQNLSTNNMSTPSTITDGFDEFAEGFATQHSSFLCSERLYFCLEERAIAFAEEELAKLISSANIAIAGYESPSIILMMLLQKYYVSHAAGAASTNSSSSSRNSSKLSLSSVRALLHSGMLVVQEYLGRHRAMAMDVGIRSELLESFPDIIQARCPGGELLHFAPAILLNLPECSTFSTLSMAEEELQLVGSKCPHPYLSLLSGSRRTVLESLYCLARITPLPLFDNNDNDTAGFNSEAANNEGSFGMTTVRNTSGGQASNQTFLCPLARPCALELLRNYLWYDKTLLELPSAYSTAVASFVDLLPDHARVRRCETAALRHTYALMFDEYDVNSKVPSDDDSTGGGSGVGGYQSQGGPSSSSSQGGKTRPCCYFVQLWSDNVAAIENTSRKVDGIDAPISQTHLKDDLVLRAMLSAYTQGLGQASLPTESVLQSKKKWDPAILSTLCRWRACLCESTDDPPPKYLCRYHSELKIFLDGRIGTKGSVGESAKYLPQKPPSMPSTVSNSDKDVVLIRAASTLLQELWDGKLKSTVRSFAKRVCYDMTLTAAHRTQSSGSGSEAERKSLRPSWARWKEDGELRRVLQSLSASFGGFDAILKIERLISSELQAIFDLGVLPTAELAVMRKDTKSFKDQMLDDPLGELEMKLCERKLHLLRARRDEEQSARIAIQRRIMKVKAMEENQFKDPANFRNQRKF